MNALCKKLAFSLTALAACTMMTAPVYADFSADTKPVTRDLSVVQRPMEHLQIAQSDLKVSAWVDHQNNTYQPGENVVLSVKANKNCYITILDVGTSGKVHIIYPNRYQQNNRVQAGQIVQIPAKNAMFDFRIGGPAGNELVKVIATTSAKPLVNPAWTTPAGPFKAVNKSPAVLAKDINVAVHQDPTNQYAEYNKVIAIAPAVVQPVPAATGFTPVPVAPAAATTGTFAASPVQPANTFGLQMRTERTMYRIGEKVHLLVTPQKDCSLTVLDVATSGQVYILFPNRFQQNNKIHAGQTVLIPSDSAAVDYLQRGPQGVESLIAICRTDNLPVYPGQYDYTTYIYQPWGSSKTLSKDLAVVLRNPTGEIAQASASYLVSQ